MQTWEEPALKSRDLYKDENARDQGIRTVAERSEGGFEGLSVELLRRQGKADVLTTGSCCWGGKEEQPLGKQVPEPLDLKHRG